MNSQMNRHNYNNRLFFPTLQDFEIKNKYKYNNDKVFNIQKRDFWSIIL